MSSATAQRASVSDQPGLSAIQRERLVAIFRGDYRGKWLTYADALLKGGVSILEITLNSPGALDAIRELNRELGGRVTVGAGTVLSADSAQAAIEAGATFVVAPDTDEAVLAVCKAHNIPAVLGAYTPTEVKRAYQLGVPMVKLFPAETAAYVKLIHAPLDHIPLMVTGGVTSETVAGLFAAGASAVGVGSYLTATALSMDEVAKRAASLKAAIPG